MMDILTDPNRTRTEPELNPIKTGEVKTMSENPEK
jgi:hypothetical protein